MERLSGAWRRLRGRVPLGVLLLGGFAFASVGILGLAAFGPPLPGPDVSALWRDRDPWEPCDPKSRQVREPSQPIAAPGRWRVEPRIPGAYDEVRGVGLGGRAYVLGGSDAAGSVARAQTYDPDRAAYSDAPRLPVALDHTAPVAYRGDIYVVGGDSDGRSTNGLWRYSPEKEIWTELTPMEMPRAAHGAAVIGDHLYVMGGTSETDFTDYGEIPTGSLEIYDFETDTWTRGPDMPTARHHFDAAAVGGRVYAIGGRKPGEFALDTVERFDPDSGEWEKLPPLPLGTGGATVDTAAGDVVVAGGGDDREGWVTRATWALDPRQERWRRLADLRVPRHGHATAVLNGRIYVLSGAPCALGGRTHSVESLRVGSIQGG